jgi:hypothetical protein
MIYKHVRFIKWLSYVGLYLVLLLVHCDLCSAAEPEKQNKRPVTAAIAGSFVEVAGDIRVDRLADGININCSEVVKLSDRTIIKKIKISRNIYIVDIVNMTFIDGRGVVDIPIQTNTSSEHGQFIGGKDEFVLSTWKLKYPEKKKLCVIVSSAELHQADGQLFLCHFPPLFISDGRVLRNRLSGTDGGH